MEEILNVSFSILCVVLSQGLVFASNDNFGSQPSPHIHQQQRPVSPGRSPLPELPALLKYNLHKINTHDPTPVKITNFDMPTADGYAVHPFIVVARLGHLNTLFIGVSYYQENLRRREHLRVEKVFTNEALDVIVIYLQDSIMLNRPKGFALYEEDYPSSTVAWAHAKALEWINTELPSMEPLLKQSLTDLHFSAPTSVEIVKNGISIGYGFAIHPYIVIARHNLMKHSFEQSTYGVATHNGTTGQLKHHRVQFDYTNEHANIVVVELQDPILLNHPVPNVFSTEHYSDEAIVWAREKAEEWKRTRLGQRNYYHVNAGIPAR